MANWKYKLQLKDLWNAKLEGKITIEELGKLVAKRIKQMSCYTKYADELLGIVSEFEHCVNNVGDFDYALGKLYDWADTPLLT